MTGRERIIAEDLRLRVLQILLEDPKYSHNADVIRASLAALGHDSRIDEVIAVVQWLAGAGLVSIVSEGPPVTARLTSRGIELAEGRTVVRGVALPAP